MHINRSTLHYLFISATIVFLQWGFAASTSAQPVAEPGADMGFAEEEASEELAPIPKDPTAARHGLGLRLRYIWVPKSLIEIFMAEAASGVSHAGFGVDYIHRKEELELSIGVEYDNLSAQDGYYVESGGSAQEPGTVDYVEFEGLSWITIDASVVYHTPLTPLVSLRYGGGIGVGFVLGDIRETDAICSGPNAQRDCIGNINGEQVNEKQDLFRYPPVLNALFGVQLSPGDNLAINFEVGLRTVLYSGVGVQYFF